MRRLLSRLGVLAITVLVAGTIAEVGLRVAWSEADAYFVFWPRLERVYHPEPGVMPGIEGPTLFKVNSEGVRGDELDPMADVRILTLGGSSTECLYLDQEEAWPDVVQQRLNADSELRVWVGNVGKSGMNARDHATQLPRMLEQLPGVDVLVVLVGVNDLFLRLQQDGDYDPYYLDDPEAEAEQMRRGFALLPVGMDRRFPPWKRLALWRLGSRVKERVLPSATGQDAAGKIYDTWRANRRSASRIRTELPELASALAEFRRNLERVLDTSTAHGARPVLLTQPTMWAADLAPELAGLMWFGGVGDFMEEPGCEYYSLEALAEGMARFNEVLREVAAERHVTCVDLAARLPRDTSVFFDDCHFNEPGAARVGELVAQALLELPPFARNDESQRGDGQ